MDPVVFSQRVVQMHNGHGYISPLVRDIVSAMSGVQRSTWEYYDPMDRGYVTMGGGSSPDHERIELLILAPAFQQIDAQEAFYLLQESLGRWCTDLKKAIIAIPSFQGIPLDSLEGLLCECYTAEFVVDGTRVWTDPILAGYLLQSSRKDEFSPRCLGTILLSMTNQKSRPFNDYYTSRELFELFFVKVELETWRQAFPLSLSNDFAREMVRYLPPVLPANMPPDCAEQLFVWLCLEKDRVELTGPTIALLTHASLSRDGLSKCLVVSAEHRADVNAVIAKARNSPHFKDLSEDSVAELIAKCLKTKIYQQDFMHILDTMGFLFSHQNFKNPSKKWLLAILFHLSYLAADRVRPGAGVFGWLLARTKDIYALPQWSEIGAEDVVAELNKSSEQAGLGLFLLHFFETLSVDKIRAILFAMVREGWGAYWRGNYLTRFLDYPSITGDDLKAAVQAVPNIDQEPQASAVIRVKSHPKYPFQVGDCCTIL